MIALTGLGYDIHRFAGSSASLMLGGVHIPSARGLDGHSDAGRFVPRHCRRAAGCGRIAGHRLLVPAGRPFLQGYFFSGDRGQGRFPIRERGGRVVNVDSSLIAEAPRISPI